MRAATFIRQRTANALHSRNITTAIHRSANISLLPAMARRIAQSLERRPNAVNDIESAIIASNQGERLRLAYLEDKPLYKPFFDVIKENKHNESVIGMALQCTFIAQKTWENQRRQYIQQIGQLTPQRFAKTDTNYRKSGEASQRGQFFELTGKDYKQLTSSQLAHCRVLQFDGIDHGGLTTMGRLANYTGFLTGSDCRTATYHYASTMDDRSGEVRTIITDRNTHTIHQQHTAQHLLHACREAGKSDPDYVFLGYSAGTIHNTGVAHAIAEAADHGDPIATHIRDNVRVLNVGMQPLWSAGETWKMPPSISLHAADDMIAPLSHHAHNVVRRMTYASPPVSEQPLQVFYHDTNPNQLWLFLKAGVTPSVIQMAGKNIGNIGGHGYAHYLAAVGLTPGINHLHPHLQKAGALIKDFIAGKSLDIPLAVQFADAGIPVEVLNKEKERAYSHQDDTRKADVSVVTAYAERMANEIIAHPERTHFLISSAIKAMPISALSK